MRMIQGCLLALCLAVVAAKPAENLDNPALRAVSTGAAQFSSDFFQSVAEENKGNLITSPLSAALVLAMATYGAAGQTEKVMRNALHIPADDNLGKTGYQNLIDTLNNVEHVKLNIANKVFVSETLKLKESYKQLTQDFFRSAAQAVDFSQSDNAAAIINDWVKAQTQDRIKDLVNPDSLDAMTALILVNAVYFKGEWKYKFNKKLTETLPFYTDVNTLKNVSMMYQKNEFNYAVLPELKAQIIEVPYAGEQVSMVIILPEEIDGLAELERKLHNVHLSDLLKKCTKQEVKLYLPKFKIESKMDLEGVLKKLGMDIIFSQNANFSGMSDSELHVSKVVQKAFVEVNEEGSEAAGATEIEIESRMLIRHNRFVARHPFLFHIVHASGTPYSQTLFTGHVTYPKTE